MGKVTHPTTQESYFFVFIYINSSPTLHKKYISPNKKFTRKRKIPTVSELTAKIPATCQHMISPLICERYLTISNRSQTKAKELKRIKSYLHFLLYSFCFLLISSLVLLSSVTCKSFNVCSQKIVCIYNFPFHIINYILCYLYNNCLVAS